ncbi:hybrid sensor histidine kinase/response regulator [Sphingobium sp. RAC03]|uniref:hybrid sensor histidine kinase/response regulator n=1 Tax=Sphingobium sp. RAC03 TaxID=1843368 RepID=UPI000856A109|nr:ATP-binding protein [Sphingobium sp. RAC03]AOF98268.1 sensory box protein [Sphingobium sp. RAC03]
MNDSAASTDRGQDMHFLSGGGVMGELVRSKDWSATPLGAPQSWPQPLKTLVALMLSADQPMFIGWGPDHIFLYNDRYAPMLADRHPAALGRTFFDVWPEIRADIAPLFAKVSAGEPVHMDDIELMLDRPGRPREAHFAFSYTPVRDAAGTVDGLFCACVETTEQILAERTRREAEASERNRLWILSEDMLARADFAGRMGAVNPAWTRVLGWSEAHLLATPYVDFMHPDDAAVTLAAIEDMSRTGLPTRFQNRIATADGGWTPIGWTVSPEPDGVNFIAIGRDLSEDKAREEQLLQTQEALRQSQKLESMGQLTGGVAHDFNNLLTPIIGSLDLLMRRGLGSERERRLIDGALQSAERAKTLVQRLLAFARRQPLQPKAVALDDLVTGMASLVSSTIGPKIDLRVSIADDLPPARADANQLEMAILNLSVNARDAMPAGGELTISASRASVRGRHPAGLRVGHYVRLSVADTGIGMDEATRARAIEPFFSTKGIGKGTGLGLSMAHGLAAQLGGGLTIISAPGEGTTVELWLPVSPDAIGSDDQIRVLPRISVARGTALLVDDEELVRMSTADMLNDLGYDVVEAKSAEEALHLIEAGVAPTILVTDHLMPGMNGEELARSLRTRMPDLPVLIVSGYAEAEGIAPDLPRLTKPFRNAELADRLETIHPTEA